MPEWLLKKDNYIPLNDKDAFINKSILSILKVLLRFRLQDEYRIDKSGINALTKLVSTFLLVIFISLSKNITFVLISGVFLLVVINFLDIHEIIYIIKMGIIDAFFAFLIFLPSIFLGYGNNALMVILKILICTAFVNMLACTTKWNDIIEALKVFHVPDIFIFILDITIKYIIVLGKFSLNMLYALKLRSVGKSNNKNASLSGIMGTMFIKSREMAEEMYGAMECRGFTGDYKIYRKFKFKTADYLCIILNIIFILTYFYFDRL